MSSKEKAVEEMSRNWLSHFRASLQLLTDAQNNERQQLIEDLTAQLQENEVIWKARAFGYRSKNSSSISIADRLDAIQDRYKTDRILSTELHALKKVVLETVGLLEDDMFRVIRDAKKMICDPGFAAPKRPLERHRSATVGRFRIAAIPKLRKKAVASQLGRADPSFVGFSKKDLIRRFRARARQAGSEMFSAKMIGASLHFLLEAACHLIQAEKGVILLHDTRTNDLVSMSMFGVSVDSSNIARGPGAEDQEFEFDERLQGIAGSRSAHGAAAAAASSDSTSGNSKHRDRKRFLELRMSASSGVAGVVFSTGIPVNVHHMDSDTPYETADDCGTPTRTVISWPVLSSGSHTVGVVQLMNKHGYDRFTTNDEFYLDFVSSLIGRIIMHSTGLQTLIDRRMAAATVLGVTNPKNPFFLGGANRLSSSVLQSQLSKMMVFRSESTRSNGQLKLNLKADRSDSGAGASISSGSGSSSNSAGHSWNIIAPPQALKDVELFLRNLEGSWERRIHETADLQNENFRLKAKMEIVQDEKVLFQKRIRQLELELEQTLESKSSLHARLEHSRSSSSSLSSHTGLTNAKAEPAHRPAAGSVRGLADGNRPRGRVAVSPQPAQGSGKLLELRRTATMAESALRWKRGNGSNDGDAGTDSYSSDNDADGGQSESEEEPGQSTGQRKDDQAPDDASLLLQQQAEVSSVLEAPVSMSATAPAPRSTVAGAGAGRAADDGLMSEVLVASPLAMAIVLLPSLKIYKLNPSFCSLFDVNAPHLLGQDLTRVGIAVPAAVAARLAKPVHRFEGHVSLDACRDPALDGETLVSGECGVYRAVLTCACRRGFDACSSAGAAKEEDADGDVGTLRLAKCVLMISSIRGFSSVRTQTGVRVRGPFGLVTVVQLPQARFGEDDLAEREKRLTRAVTDLPEQAHGVAEAGDSGAVAHGCVSIVVSHESTVLTTLGRESILPRPLLSPHRKDIRAQPPGSYGRSLGNRSGGFDVRRQKQLHDTQSGGGSSSSAGVGKAGGPPLPSPLRRTREPPTDVLTLPVLAPGKHSPIRPTPDKFLFS